MAHFAVVMLWHIQSLWRVLKLCIFKLQLDWFILNILSWKSLRGKTWSLFCFILLSIKLSVIVKPPNPILPNPRDMLYRKMPHGGPGGMGTLGFDWCIKDRLQIDTIPLCGLVFCDYFNPLPHCRSFNV